MRPRRSCAKTVRSATSGCENDGVGRFGCGEGDGEADGREAGVDQIDDAHRLELHLRRHAEDDPLAHCGGGEVESKLSRERPDVERPPRERRRPLSCEPKDERWAECVPGVAEMEED